MAASSSTSSAMSALFGSELVTKDGTGSTDALLAGKTIGIYFSAHWCPPCRNFTPRLAEMYRSTFQAKGLEIIFASSDKDQASFDEYYAEMPWLALPYANRELKESLSRKYNVCGIPSLVILDSDGNVITTEGVHKILTDPSGARFPWRPQEGTCDKSEHCNLSCEEQWKSACSYWQRRRAARAAWWREMASKRQACATASKRQSCAAASCSNVKECKKGHLKKEKCAKNEAHPEAPTQSASAGTADSTQSASDGPTQMDVDKDVSA